MLCRRPLSFRVIQTYSSRGSNWLSHCHWELFSRTEELNDFQLDNDDDSETEFLIVWSNRVNIPFIHVGKDQITPVMCETWLWFLAPNYKWICKWQKPAETPTFSCTTSGGSDKSWTRKPRACFHVYSSQARLNTATVWWIDYQIISTRVQNTAARLIFNLRKYDRITPALVTLHWLPVKYRIEFKTLLIVFKDFMARHLATCKKWPHKILFHEIQWNMCPGSFKIQAWDFQKVCIVVCEPLAWNCLSKEIRSCDEIEAFKRNLQNNLFVKLF